MDDWSQGTRYVNRRLLKLLIKTNWKLVFDKLGSKPSGTGRNRWKRDSRGAGSRCGAFSVKAAY